MVADYHSRNAQSDSSAGYELWLSDARFTVIERKKKIDEKEKQKQKEAVKQTSMLHFEGDVLPKLFSNLFRRILKFCQHSASENELIVRASTIVRLGGIYSTYTIWKML